MVGKKIIRYLNETKQICVERFQTLAIFDFAEDNYFPVFNVNFLFFQGSTDSGRGGSEIHFESLPSHENNILNYAFEIPQRVVGLLIGRQGKNVNLIKEETNVDVLIKRHPTTNMNKICMLTGNLIFF